MKSRIRMDEEVAVYHCTSRIVAGERLLDRHAKEVLRKMLWQVAAFSGVEIVAYCLMTNHLHVLVRVPPPADVPVDELMRRFRILYPDPSASLMPDADWLESILVEEDSAEARFWKARLLARMHDVSEFMKTLKQRFTIWFNRNHGRFGTLWAERFKSVLVEDHSSALAIVAAYIDLNPVRSGQVEDPADYRWSSYGEAMGGEKSAQSGLARAIGEKHWKDAAASYRMILYGKGSTGRYGEQGAIPQERAMEVLQANGKLPLSILLRCRVRYLTEGAVLGSEAFVRNVGALQDSSAAAKKKALGKMPIEEGSALRTWRRLQKRPVQ